MAKKLREILEHFEKAGEFSPEMINVGGTLRPQETDKFIGLVVGRSPILSMVTVDRSDRLIKDVNAWEFVQEVLVRIPEGKAPADFTALKNAGKQLHMLPAQLFSKLPFSFLRDNKHRSNIEAIVAGKLAEIYGNDVVRLAFVGVADDYVKGDALKGKFERLNKGWVQLIKEAAGSHKINATTFDTATGTDWTKLFGAMLETLPDMYKTNTVRFLVNKGDAEQYAQQVGQLSGAFSLLLSGKAPEYLGYEIVAINEMPKGTVVLTPMPNLVYGVNTTMERYRELKGEERAISYTYDSNFDYQVAVDDAAVLAYAQ